MLIYGSVVNPTSMLVTLKCNTPKYSRLGVKYFPL